jgi:GTP-binding protein YchF
VPDPRLPRVGAIYRPKKITPTTITFHDVAGLVRGASHGEGLGNQFLGHLRSTDALVLVVRCFPDPVAPTSAPAADPAGDAETVALELGLADLETVMRRQEKIERQVQVGKSSDAAALPLLVRLRAHLDGGAPARTLPLRPEERPLLQDLQLLTYKPLLYVANLSESDLGRDKPAPLVPLRERAALEDAAVVTVAAKMEADLRDLEPADADAYLQSLGLHEPATLGLIRAAYQLLGLVTFFTGNETEVRAWAIRSGSRAPEAAGVVHTDFQRGFIKAEVIACDALLAAGSLASARAHGKMRLEGRDYVVQDGDVMLFRFNL